MLCRLLYKLSLRDLAQIRRRRKGRLVRRWYVDETYLRVTGKWCYLYRAIDRDGNLVDSMLSAAVTWMQPNDCFAAPGPW